MFEACILCAVMYTIYINIYIYNFIRTFTFTLLRILIIQCRGQRLLGNWSQLWECLPPLFWNISWRGSERKKNRIADFELTFSHKNNEITTNCWKANNKDWSLPKKDILYPKRKKKSQWDGRRCMQIIQSNPIPSPPDGQLTNRRIIISKKSSHRSENSEPHIRLPSLRVLHWEKEAPEYFSLKASGAWSQERHKTGVNRDSTLGAHRVPAQ